MADRFNQSPRQPITLEAYNALHPDLGVARDRIGHVAIGPWRGARRGDIGELFVFPMGTPEGRLGVGLSARRSRGTQDYTYVNIFVDSPEDAQSYGPAGLDPDEMVQMARDGMELFDGFLSLAGDDRRMAQAMGRVADDMETAEGLLDTFGQAGLHVVPVGPVLLDAHAAWRTAFPA